MSSWKEFPKEFPEKDENIWITNGEKIHFWTFGTYSAFLKAYGDNWKYWMPLEKPEIPMKELHDCYLDFPRHISCYETISGKLLIDYGGITREINFCPVCGYSLKRDAK